MKLKKLLLGASVALLGLSLASCSKDKKEVRNTVTPYGSLDGKQSTVVASAYNDSLQLTLDTYYTRLRATSYSLVSNKINEVLYKAEYNALQAMYKNESLSQLSADQVNALKITDTAEDGSTSELYEITQDKYAELRVSLLENINNSIARNIFSASDADAIAKKTEKDINTAIKTFIDTQAKSGVSINADDIVYFNKDDSRYTLNKDNNFIQFSDETLEKLSSLVDSSILSQAKNYNTKKALYKIADEEYIIDEENDEETKNNYYLFKDSTMESTYNSSYKTFGTYKAIVIQFNSRRDALKAIEAIGSIDPNNAEAALNTYIELYNKYYGYKLNETVNADSDEFTYRVDEKVNDFNDLASSVSGLVMDTLKDNDYLTEPRNINNKYVLAYRIETQYDYYDDNDPSKQLDFENLSEAQKAEIYQKIRENVITANSTSYESKNEANIIGDTEIKIYDPLFEYKFEYAHPNDYTVIEDKVNATDNLIFSIGDDTYTVEQFYADASKAQATNILTEYFQLEYANQYYDKYVDEYYISEDIHDNNVDTLNESIKKFEKDEISTYPVEIGLETYLVSSYGYKTKDEVIKYYYDAKKALDTYNTKKVYEEWVSESTVDGEKVYSISDAAKNGFLKNILETGNKNYDNLFSINLDHILINIDDNADGSPDDPADFLTKNPSKKTAFENAVTELAQAIYLEATHEDYKDNTLFETLTYIKTQYEEGGELRSLNDGTTWDSYKDFNFLLTVEQLASSGDITQESVNNFVIPFKEYVENIYKTASTNENVEDEYEDGIFYFCYENNGEIVGSTADKAEDVNLITFDALCATNYGYHMIVLNSFEGPTSTRFTESDDVSGFQADLQVVVREYEDKDEKEVVSYINTNSYNDNIEEAGFNQLFIYYVQKQNGDESSLDSDIDTIMSSLFDEVINKYVSSNFQAYLLLELLDIQIKDVTIADSKIQNFAVTAQIEYYKNVITEYDAESEYTSWVDGTYTNWERPDLLD